MSQAPSARALRVGILIRDNLVEERVIRDASPVTFGQSLRCTLSVPVEGLPHAHVLSARDDGRLLLRLTTGMQGRLAHGATIQTFDELRTGASDRGVWSVPVPPGARGKVELADVTVLFQDVAMPPASPPLKLPASLRGTLADRIDKRLAVILGSSIVVHIGIAAWAWATDVETGTLGSARVPQLFQQETVEVTLPDPSPPTSTEPGTAAPIAPSQTPAPIVRPTRIAPRSSPDISDAEAARLAAILTNDDGATHGPAGMRGRSPGADLDRQIADIRDTNRRVTDDRGGFRDGHERLGTAPAPNLRQPGELAQLPPHADEEPVRIVPTKPKPTNDPTTLTAEMVLAKINGAYMPGLQRCYRLGLNHDQSLAGKINVAFTVNESGRVTEATASGVGVGVDTCVQHLMTGWHFSPPPRSKTTGEPTDAGFEVSLVLGH